MNKPIICLGSAFWDTIFQVDAIPSAGIKVLPSRAVQAASGMATSAAITIARLGGQVQLWSRVGADDTGQRFIRELQQERVNTEWLRAMAGTQTPFSSIIVDRRGERVVIPFADPAVPADTSWLPLGQVADACAVLVDVRWVEGAVALLHEARRCGVPAILDADTAAFEVLNQLVPLATHVLFSEPALQIFCPHESADAALLEVASRYDHAVVGVTQGAQGAAIWARDWGAVRHFTAPSIKPVDTLNAGDIWHGTFAWGLARQWPIDRIVRWANVAAAMKCEVFGGRLGAPTLEALVSRAETLGLGLAD